MWSLVLKKIEDTTHKVLEAAKKAGFKNFGHAAASISKDAKASIISSPDPSPAGSPPHTRKRNHYRRAIRYKAEQDGAVIGFAASVIGQAGRAHEFGGDYMGEIYPARPTMGPALERAAPRFGGSWEGSIGGSD